MLRELWDPWMDLQGFKSALHTPRSKQPCSLFLLMWHFLSAIPSEVFITIKDLGFFVKYLYCLKAWPLFVPYVTWIPGFKSQILLRPWSCTAMLHYMLHKHIYQFLIFKHLYQSSRNIIYTTLYLITNLICIYMHWSGILITCK